MILISIYIDKKKLMIFMANLLLLISIIFFVKFQKEYDSWMMMYYWMGIDMMSFNLIMLSLWIIALVFLVSLEVENNKKYSFLLLILLMGLILSFSTLDFFIFFFFFEVSCIPLFLIILGWGYQPERLNASLYLFFYCMFASLPLFFIIFILYNKIGSLDYDSMMWNNYSNDLMYFFLIFAFLVKLPMFLFHSWLPKAHVEAPVAGSMILAGVLLKLGGYGLYRATLVMMKSGMKINYWIIIISLLGMIILSMVCLRQFDMKVLVAYSSVVHMSMVIMGFLSYSNWGYLGSLLMMIGHGFCSSAMFVLVNYFYERTHSRNIMVNKGMIYLLPSMCLWWFIFCSCNMAAPISLNMISEIMISISMVMWCKNLMIFLMFGLFMSAVYSLYLFSISYHGKVSKYIYKIYPNNVNNFIVMIGHWIPLNFLILKLEFFY
nr:NADH dehydrogenase subunit 4 [Ceratosolen fusciceps]